MNISFKDIVKNNYLLIIGIVVFAVAFSELLVYLQISLFWSEELNENTYQIGFWTPLIDSIFVVFLLLYLKSSYEKKLLKKNLLLEEAKKIATLGSWELDLITMESKWSHDINKMVGFPEEQIINTAILKSILTQKAWDSFEKALKDSISKERDFRHSFKIKNQIDGHIMWFECRGKVLKDKNIIIGTIQDITNATIKQKEVERYVDMIDENIIISSTNLNGIITHASKAFCEISGYSKEELIGSNHNIIRHEDMPKKLFQELWNTIKTDETWYGEIKNRKKDGSNYWVLTTISSIYDEDNNKIGYRSIRHDITDKKKIEEISIKDGLTGIYNRGYFNEMFPKIINSAKRKNELVSFLILDVDHFKQYNDTYGHQMGDEVLIQVALAIESSTKRVDDYCFRLGGEEFGVVFKTDTKEQAKEFSNNIKQKIERLEIEHKNNSASKYITASFGLVSTSSNDIGDPKEFYNQADKFLYKAKHNGRNCVEVNE